MPPIKSFTTPRPPGKWREEASCGHVIAAGGSGDGPEKIVKRPFKCAACKAAQGESQ